MEKGEGRKSLDGNLVDYSFRIFRGEMEREGKFGLLILFFVLVCERTSLFFLKRGVGREWVMQTDDGEKRAREFHFFALFIYLSSLFSLFLFSWKEK